MRRDVFAEWMLGRFMQTGRAAALVGDLQETALVKGAAWFWRSFLGVFLASAWRPVMGYLTAAVGGGYLATRISGAYFFSTLRHTPTMVQRVWGSSLTVPIALLCFIALYGAFRFGVRDIVARLAAAYAVLGAMAVCFWWQTAVPLVALGVAGVLLLASMFQVRARRGTAVVWMTAGIQTVLWIAAIDLVAGCAKWWRLSLTTFAPLGVASYFLMVWLTCRVCSRMHRKMLETFSDREEVSL